MEIVCVLLLEFFASVRLAMDLLIVAGAAGHARHPCTQRVQILFFRIVLALKLVTPPDVF